MSVSAVWAELQGEKYLSLESFRKNGVGVRTPIWFAAAAGAGAPELFVYTTADSGKAKRIRRSGRIRIAPCNARGTVTGNWLDAEAKIVSGEAFDRGMQLLNQKYRPWKQLLDISSRLFARHERIVLVIRPAGASSTGQPGA